MYFFFVSVAVTITDQALSISGKLFALLSALYATLPIVAALTYTQLYNSTMNSYPGAVFLLSAALLVFCAVLLGLVENWHSKVLLQIILLSNSNTAPIPKQNNFFT